jgi:hypothetical protein
MQTKKVAEYLKYEFSEEETRDNAKSLARTSQQLSELELKKKQMMADIKSEIDDANAYAARLARWVNDEYDFRNVECEVTFDTPSPGWKTIVRLDTGESVKEARMTSEEMQQALPLGV